MKHRIVAGLILLAFCVGLPAAATGLPAAPRRPQRPVAPFEAGVAACLAWAVADTAVDERGQRIYDLVLRLESGELLLRSEADIESVARFMADRLDRERNEHVRGRCAEYLAKYPHHAAAEALVRAVHRGGRFNEAQSALEALAALGDPRGRDLLIERVGTGEDLRRGFEHGLVQLIATYGDSTYLAPLSALAADERAPAERRTAAGAALSALARRLDTHLVDAFGVGDAIAARLRTGEVVALPADKNEMFELYGPEFPFITSDVIYHTWMILLRAALDDLEKLVMEPRLRTWSARLAMAALRRAGAARGGEREAACALAARLVVPARLLGGLTAEAVRLPPTWKLRVEAELKRIEAAEGVHRSPLTATNENYGAYRPRGRLGQAPDRTAYARALTWYGRLSFPVASAPECRMAAALIDVLESDPRLRDGWEEFETRLTRFFGPSDDLTVRDYRRALGVLGLPTHPGAGGSSTASRRLTTPDIDKLQAELRRAPAPRINPTVGAPPSGGPAWPEATRGLRLFGARRTRVVAEVQRQMDGGAWPPRGACLLPALFPAAARNELCPDSLKAPGETTMTPPPATAPTDPYANLGEGALHALAPLFDPTDPRRPEFMRGPSWRRKQANAALGAWVETQHATAAYNKDANHYASIEIVKDRLHGYVEPVPAFYARLDSLVQRLSAWCAADSLFQLSAADTAFQTETSLGLNAVPRSYYDDVARRESRIRLRPADLEEFSRILRHLESIANKELAGQDQSVDDAGVLKTLYRRLMYLSFNRSGTKTARISMAVVTDVAHEWQSGQSWQVGVGRPWLLYVAVPWRGDRYVCKGAIYSYTELTRPVGERLTDVQWREMTGPKRSDGPAPWIADSPLAAPHEPRGE